MQAIDIENITSVTANEASIKFTDWQHDEVELWIASKDDYSANVFGDNKGIGVSAHIQDMYHTLSVLVHIQDVEHKAIHVMSSVTIERSLFEGMWEDAAMGAMTKAVQEAVQYALTYAGLVNNNGNTGIEKMNQVLSNFSSEFSSAISEYLKDDAKVTSVKKNASLVAV